MITDQLSGVPFHSQCANTMWVNGPFELQFVALFVVWRNDCVPNFSKVSYVLAGLKLLVFVDMLEYPLEPILLRKRIIPC